MDVASVGGAAGPATARRARGESGEDAAGFVLDGGGTDTAAAMVEGGAARRLGAAAGQLIQSGQEVGEDDDSTLPIGLRHYMEDIAASPEYAEAQAKAMAYGSPVVFFNISDAPRNGEPPEVWTAWTARMEAKSSLAGQVQDKLRALYESGRAQGADPAELYADMLRLKSSQSSEYMETQGPSGLQVRQGLKDQLAVLMDALAKKDGRGS